VSPPRWLPPAWETLIHRLDDLAARVILATSAVDRTYRRFDRLRSELVSAFASDAVLDHVNDLAYGRTDAYRPDRAAFREYLFPWEEKVVERFFPRPPARIVVGGAGGGREVFALIRMGFDVVAFEPSHALITSMAETAPPQAAIDIRQGSYDQMPTLFPHRAGPGFEAAILGWGSFSHLRTETARLETLESFARLTEGPILVSFLGLRVAVSPQPAKLGRLLPRRPGRTPDDVFSVGIGFYHRVNEDEVRRLAGAAGLRVVYSNFDERDTNWPHVVLTRRAQAG
jgi:hypothetical protein